VIYGFRIGSLWTHDSYPIYASRHIIDVPDHIVLHCDLNYCLGGRWIETGVADGCLPLRPLSLHITLGWGHIRLKWPSRIPIRNIINFFREIKSLTEVTIGPYTEEGSHRHCFPRQPPRDVETESGMPNLRFQSDCHCGNGDVTGCEWQNRVSLGLSALAHACCLARCQIVWDGVEKEAMTFRSIEQLVRERKMQNK
jgi:hypothetical protein